MVDSMLATKTQDLSRLIQDLYRGIASRVLSTLDHTTRQSLYTRAVERVGTNKEVFIKPTASQFIAQFMARPRPNSEEEVLLLNLTPVQMRAQRL